MFPVRLETERLVLRELSLDDLPAIQLFAADPEVVKYHIWGPNTEDDTRAFLSPAIAAQKESPRLAYEFAIIDKATDTLIGGCGIRSKNPESRIGDLGYTLQRDFWGKGLATETARRLVSFGFDDLNLHRIWATCDPENIASARVLEKVGFKKEGHMREDTFCKGKWRDSLLFAVLETD
jgi:RimJ/RimL family protein N-acetyltransferase